ncbi:MAG: hypothetical protein RLZZ200_3112 [Pseudomonadota bacterium]|jgi:hypothetical protein
MGLRHVACVSAALLCLSACSKKVVAPEWTRVTPEGAERVVYLDTAHIVVNAGLVYITLQSRKAGSAPGAPGAPFGLSHAEANCPANRVDPTALKEDQYDASGRKLEMKLVSLTAEETADVLARSCGGR